MIPFRYIIIIIVFSFSIVVFGNFSHGKTLYHINDEDSLIKRTDNYIRYINAIGAHGNQYMKTYVKLTGQKKFVPVLNPGHWPDSIEQTVNVISYEGKPAEYSETPFSASGESNIEYDNYFYNGKLLAYRYFEVMNNSFCTGGTLTNTVILYYDSTGKYIKTVHTLFDDKNNSIDPDICLSAKSDLTHIYNSFSETPLAKEGIEKKQK